MGDFETVSFYREDAEATYRSLGLGRAPLRLGELSNPLGRVIPLGGESPERPRILIERNRYEEILSDLVSSQLRNFAGETRSFPADFLTAYFRERFRSTAYDKLLQEQDRGSDAGVDPLSVDRRARIYRGALLRRLLSHIERRRMSSRPWLDLLWQKTVGPQIASESQLVRIDRAAGRAILRSLNSSLAFSLRRRSDLPEKLSEALGVPIREIRVGA
ncbi:MAG: hypothetical protein AB7T14_03485 [Candidatus Methylacidiphilaceae bacterium]